MSNNKKHKHSIIDKLIFIFLVLSSVVALIWDIFSNFISDQYWQVKLLIIIVGSLSGFFTVLSFQWDKKFTNASKEIIISQNNGFENIKNDIQVFIQEDFHSYESFNDAIMPIISSKKEFDAVKIFAYSAKNYIECLMRSNIKIKCLKLCLKRANDYSAWFVNNQSRVAKYKNELQLVIENLESLKDSGKVDNYEVHFYDFESYSHFGIFDDYMLFGDLIPLFSEKKTVQIGRIQTLKQIGRNGELFTNKLLFFDQLFSSTVTDSGLKLLHHDCHYCKTTEMILDPHHINGTITAYGKCDISLINDVNYIQDFLLEPDFHPISELHMLLICKFHILNLYDYLCHKNAIENLEKIVYEIRNAVYKLTGQEIILFEHGTSSHGANLSGSSIEHLHIHIIYKPSTYDYIKAISTENIDRQKPIFDKETGLVKFSSIKEFANDNLLKNKDYFMIWEPGVSKEQCKIYVWVAKEKESQFLRRIFFQGLSKEEKEKLYGITNGNFDDEYNWKVHKYTYTDERLSRHLQIGEAIKNEQNRKIS